MNMIYVANLSYNATEQQLKEHFQDAGDISEIKLIKDSITDQLKGFGFITFCDSNGAKKAIEDMNGKDFLGRRLFVNIARNPVDKDRR